MMDMQSINALAKNDMLGVNALIGEQLKSDVALINQLGIYIVNSGGKRLRPLLTVITARALGYDGKDHQKLATIIEFIHTATLLHDDVVDESDLRRGRNTANAVFPEFGDFGFSDDPTAASEHLNFRAVALGQKVDHILEVFDMAALVGTDGNALNVFLDGRGDHFVNGAVMA